MIRQRSLVLWAVISIVLGLSGCAGTTPPQVPVPAITNSPISPQPAPTVQDSPILATDVQALPVSKPGTATVAGTIFSRSGNGPVPGTIFYLYRLVQGETGIPAVMGSPRTDRGDVTGKTDGQGRFILTNVPPGNYLLAVWAPLTWLIVPTALSDEAARVITTKPDQRVDLGRLELDWPQ